MSFLLTESLPVKHYGHKIKEVKKRRNPSIFKQTLLVSDIRNLKITVWSMPVYNDVRK